MNKLITGERIQFKCSHFLGKINDFNFNPNVLKFQKNKCIDLDNLNNNIPNDEYIFCYTHLLENIDFLIKKLKYFQNNFSLVFHNSDHNFNKEHIKLFDELPLLKTIFTQNINVIDKRIIPLPIGIANSQWIHGNLFAVIDIKNKNIKKINDFYFNFNINTNKKVRTDCFTNVINLGIKWVQNKSYNEYLETLASYKYCICPEGNGIDTHRMWECLYLNVIPICKRNILVEYYSKYFPIIIVDNWIDINKNELINNYEAYYKFINDNPYLDLDKIFIENK